jgi:hypothetical protein
LDVASYGPTEEKARQNLEEAISLVLKGTAEDGILKELLTEAGFKIKIKQSNLQKYLFPYWRLFFRRKFNLHCS